MTVAEAADGHDCFGEGFKHRAHACEIFIRPTDDKMQGSFPGVLGGPQHGRVDMCHAARRGRDPDLTRKQGIAGGAVDEDAPLLRQGDEPVPSQIGRAVGRRRR